MNKDKNTREIKYLVVHCSATQPSDKIDASDIYKWHIQRGFTDIGYHYIIKTTGEVQRGRRDSIPGAHVKNHNANSLGICLIGGVDAKGKSTDNFTPRQKASLRNLLLLLKLRYKEAEVLGHRDFKGVKKDCPCFDVRKWWADGNKEQETIQEVT
jgi:N-acetylmuramoyl-L-alanine amidase